MTLSIDCCGMKRMMMLTLSRFLFFALITIKNVSSFNCTKGCDLNPQVNDKLVCGKDNITYMNRCLAVCQGVEVATGKQGACDSDSTFNEDQLDFSTFVGVETIDKFKKQGFKFAFKWNRSKFKKGNVRKEPVFNETNLPNTTITVKNFQSRRLTHEGYEYVTNQTSDLPPFDKNRTYNGFKPPGITRNRELSIIGQDTRTRVNPTTSYPSSAVVSINYDDGSVAYCTGTVIAPDAVLTAGHCVYDARSGWNGHSDISPALNLLGNEPFGRWNVSEITTYSQWQSRGDTDYDMAVVRYFPNEKNENVGSVVGYVGVAPVENIGSDANLQASTISGYPGDHDYEMWNTGKCPSGYSTRLFNEYKVFYDCDTVGGMSGSGIIGPDNKARGMLLFWCRE